MDTTIIDELYETYREDIDCETKFKDYLKVSEKFGGGKKLIEDLKEYVRIQTQDFSNFFVSNKETNNEVANTARDIKKVFESLAMSIDFLLSEYAEKDAKSGYFQLKDRSNFEERVTERRPQDLFKVDLKFVEEAFKKYGAIDKETFDRTLNLIKYIKKNKLLKKLYSNQGWYEMDFENLIVQLYDFIDDKTIFNQIKYEWYDNYNNLFDMVKENCKKIKLIKFDRYRPKLNSNKQLCANFGKLIFCKNLLLFYETGIMPYYEGYIESSVDDWEQMELIDNFQKLYSKSYDTNSFKSEQGNFICKPEIYSQDYKIEKSKKVVQGDKLVIGFIISCSDTMKYYKINYLLHIEISDINNEYSNYEIQFNLIPQGRLDQRLQLIRLDNWEHMQAHRNVAKKLETTTHIHLYNEFDLLRGKVNGNFDIAYNLEGASINFETSLQSFLRILNFDYNIEKAIYEKTMRAVSAIKKTSVIEK